MTWTLAARGAVKHWRRSAVTAGAVAVACAVMIAVGSLLNGIDESFLDSVIPASGHVRIDSALAPKAVNPLGLRSLLDDSEAVLAAVRGLGDPRIAAAEAVQTFGALLVEDTGSGDPRNLAMRGIGLSPETRFADNVREALVAGSFLPGGEGLCLSEAAARLVGTGLGGTVLVLVQDSSGQPWYESLPVTGIFRTDSRDFDETTFYAAEAKAAELLDVAGRAREVRLLLGDRGQADAVAAEVAGALRVAAGGAAPGGEARDGGPGGIRVQSWREANASVVGLLVFVNVMLAFLMSLFAVVAAAIVANTSLMSVMERLREFGTMRAIGLRSRDLSRVVLAEGALNGLAGAVLGMALGSAVVALLMRGGLDLGGLMESLGLRRYNRPRPDALWYAACAAASVAVCLAATGRAALSVRSRSVAESLASGAAG